LSIFQNDGQDIVIEYDVTIEKYSYIGVGVDVNQQFNYSTPIDILTPKSTTLYYNRQKHFAFFENLFFKENDNRLFEDRGLEGYEFNSARYYQCPENILSPNCEKNDLNSYINNGTAMVVMFTDKQYPRFGGNGEQLNTGFPEDYQRYAKYYFFDINFQNVSSCKIGL
jgi:hypothetical protein